MSNRDKPGPGRGRFVAHFAYSTLRRCHNNARRRCCPTGNKVHDPDRSKRDPWGSNRQRNSFPPGSRRLRLGLCRLWARLAFPRGSSAALRRRWCRSARAGNIRPARRRRRRDRRKRSARRSTKRDPNRRCSIHRHSSSRDGSSRRNSIASWDNIDRRTGDPPNIVSCHDAVAVRPRRLRVVLSSTRRR